MKYLSRYVIKLINNFIIQLLPILSLFHGALIIYLSKTTQGRFTLWQKQSSPMAVEELHIKQKLEWG